MASNPLDPYVCPRYKGEFQQQANVLLWAVRQQTIDIASGNPDPLLHGMEKGPNPDLRKIEGHHTHARLCESRLAFPLSFIMPAGWPAIV